MYEVSNEPVKVARYLNYSQAVRQSGSDVLFNLSSGERKKNTVGVQGSDRSSSETEARSSCFCCFPVVIHVYCVDSLNSVVIIF